VVVVEGIGGGGRERAYQTAGGVDARVARPDAVEPFWPAELPEAVFGHCDRRLVGLGGTAGIDGLNRSAGRWGVSIRLAIEKPAGWIQLGAVSVAVRGLLVVGAVRVVVVVVVDRERMREG
jgi:hypothetical protein